MEDLKLLGIDSGLVDRIYFPTQADKTEYLAKIESIFKTLAIKIGDDRLDVINKIADANADLEFLIDVLAFTGDQQYSKNSDRNNYYTNCWLCEYNVAAKVAAKVNDFRSEEVLFESIISMDLAGYAKANLIFNMGRTFSGIEQWKMADSYFDLFRKTAFELSPITVSDFYRAIGELYMKAGKKEISLNWFKDGLRLNPKLAVKRMIKKLETI